MHATGGQGVTAHVHDAGRELVNGEHQISDRLRRPIRVGQVGCRFTAEGRASAGGTVRARSEIMCA